MSIRERDQRYVDYRRTHPENKVGSGFTQSQVDLHTVIDLADALCEQAFVVFDSGSGVPELMARVARYREIVDS